MPNAKEVCSCPVGFTLRGIEGRSRFIESFEEMMSSFPEGA